MKAEHFAWPAATVVAATIVAIAIVVHAAMVRPTRYTFYFSEPDVGTPKVWRGDGWTGEAVRAMYLEGQMRERAYFWPATSE
jgi:hypothetical protein